MSNVRWVLCAFALLGAMVVASLTATPSGWQLAVQWAQQFDARAPVAAECPVLHGESAAGSSFACYLEAIRLAGGVRPNEHRLRELLEHGAAVQPTAADQELLAGLEPAVLALRQGAHRCGVPEPDASSFDFIDVFGPHDALLLAARELAASGDTRQAVHCLLDGLACGVDVAVHQFLGAVLVVRTAAEIDDPLLQAADTALLADLDRALAAADAAFVLDMQPVAQTAAWSVRRLLDPKELTAFDLGMASPLVAWRHGFSVRDSGMARAAVLVELAQRFERETPATEAWPERKQRLEAAVAEDRANNPDLHLAWLAHMVGIEELRREASARLRLLRLAVAFHRRAPMPSLADPLGHGPLAVRVDGELATFGSVGPDLERTARRRP